MLIMKKLEIFKEDNVKKGLKKHIPNSILKKLNNTKNYYIELGHDLKELGSDIVNGFLHSKFLMSIALVGLIDFSMLGYIAKHDNPTKKKEPLIVERHADYTIHGARPNLVVTKEPITDGKYVEIMKCKDLKKNYYKTLRSVLNSESYKKAGIHCSQELVVNDFIKMINQFNENTLYLKYNFAALVQRSMANVSKEKIQEIALGQTKNLNDAEKTLAIQLGIYDYLDNQLKVRLSGTVENWEEQDVLRGNDNHLFCLYQFPGEKYNETSYKNMMEFGGKGIKSFAKTFQDKYFCDDCLSDVLVMEMLQQNIANTYLDKVSEHGFNKDVILSNAQIQINKSIEKNIGEHFDLYDKARRTGMISVDYNDHKQVEFER